MSDIDDAKRILYQAGLAKRREVLGDAWVDATIESRTDFNADFQDMITRTAWQEIWLRDGLAESTRRLLTLAITASTGRWDEFRLHVRSALAREAVTEIELRETLMQLAVYAGVPAANTAFREAQAILDELSHAD
jgi:3-oxoadipate enol-lactonase / 4-carboxymuconolactone decarboxylase